MLLTKTIEPKDFELLQPEIVLLKDTLEMLEANKVRIDVGNENRYWEYGMAISALTLWSTHISKKKADNILEVGSGLSLLGPTLVHKLQHNVTEVEPDYAVGPYRQKCRDIFIDNDGGCRLNWVHSRLEDFTSLKKFDVVFSISVIEHVQDDIGFLDKLASLVAPGGLLFMTMDVVPEKGKQYVFDNLRIRNYDMTDVASFKSLLVSKEFTPFGEVDLIYRGNYLYDSYSFCSLAMVKE